MAALLHRPSSPSSSLDGEASFYLSILKNDKYNTGFSVQLFFEISLHKKDKAILELFQSF